MSVHELYSALVTPYAADGQLDVHALSGLLQFQHSLGLTGVFVGGSSGEAVLQGIEERQAVLAAVGQVNPGLKLIAHIGAVATQDVLALSETANRSGYAYVSAISPFYYKFSEAELFAHYSRIADGSAIPLIAYNFPDKGLGLSLTLARRLLDHPNVAGVKFTSADLYMLDQLKQSHPDKVVFNGFDELLIAGLSMGADGAIGTTFNFMGDVFRAIADAYVAGDMAEARRLQTMANRLIEKVYPSIIDGTKYMLGRMGQPVGRARAPFQPVDWAADAELEARLQALLLWRAERANQTVPRVASA